MKSLSDLILEAEDQQNNNQNNDQQNNDQDQQDNKNKSVKGDAGTFDNGRLLKQLLKDGLKSCLVKKK